MDIATELLPLPDSPTSPSTSPRSRVRLTSLAADVISPSSFRNETSRSSICNNTGIFYHISALLVVSGLPDANGRPVRLNLVNVASLDPDLLRLLDDDRRGLLDNDRRRLLDDDRLRHYGRLLNNDRRARIDDRSGERTADYSADESRPEVAAAASPVSAMAVMVVDRPRTPAVMRSPVPAACERSAGHHRGHAKHNYEFLVHRDFLSAHSCACNRDRKTHFHFLTKFSLKSLPKNILLFRF